MRLFIADVLDKVRFEPVKLTLDGFGTFGDIYWIGLKDDEGLPTDSPFPAAMEVEYISLMRSDRGRNGMIYTNMGDFACN